MTAGGATARMHQAKAREVNLYVNAGKGRKWTKEVVSSGSSHSMRIMDVDGEGWQDLYGADWEGHVVELWRNAGRRILAK